MVRFYDDSLIKYARLFDRLPFNLSGISGELFEHFESAVDSLIKYARLTAMTHLCRRHSTAARWEPLCKTVPPADFLRLIEKRWQLSTGNPYSLLRNVRRIRCQRKMFIVCFIATWSLWSSTVPQVGPFRFCYSTTYMAFRKVPIGTLRNMTVSGWKCLALRRRQGLVDFFVRIEVLCGFTVSLVRLFRFYRSIISRFAKYQLVLCETRRFLVGNALLGEGGSLSSIVSPAVGFCVALLSFWFACFGFIYRYHRVSQSTNWYFAKRDGYKRKNESSATWSVKCGFDRTFLLLSFVRCFVSQSTISFRFAKYRKPNEIIASAFAKWY